MSKSKARHLDPNFEDFVVEKVFRSDGEVLGLAVRRPGDPEGYCKLVTLPVDDPVDVEEGDDVRLYDDPEVGLRGADVNGVNLYYWSKERKQRYGEEAAEERRRRMKREFEENREEMDAKYGALPEVFRRRIDRFRGNNPDFRWMYEDYELFVCEEAVKIAEALETPEAVEEFVELSPGEQKELVDHSPKHSNLSFGGGHQVGVPVPEGPGEGGGDGGCPIAPRGVRGVRRGA